MTVSPQHGYGYSLRVISHDEALESLHVSYVASTPSGPQVLSSQTSRSSGMPCDTFQPFPVQHEKLCSRSKLPTSRTYTTRFSSITDLFHVLEALEITGVDIHKIEFLTMFPLPPLPP